VIYVCMLVRVVWTDPDRSDEQMIR
jgi:hypothetical protein